MKITLPIEMQVDGLPVKTCPNPIILKFEIQAYSFMRKLSIKSSVRWLEEKKQKGTNNV